MSGEVFLVGGPAWAPKSSAFITSEKPRMAFSGVRSSWAHRRQEARLGQLASSAAPRPSSIEFGLFPFRAISASFSARKDRPSTEVE